jgi:hypothetical protein
MLANAFDAIFDDVYQDDWYTRNLRIARTLEPADLRPSLAVAALYDTKLFVPGRMLIDHIPAIRLLEETAWARIAARCLTVATYENSWDEFQAVCGGTPSTKPLSMSSFGGKFNREIEELWDGGKGYLASREAFSHYHPHARSAVEFFKVHGVGRRAPVQSEPYQAFLARRLRSAGFGDKFLRALHYANSRATAIEGIKELADTVSPERFPALVGCAVSAKHDEIAAAVGASGIVQPVPPSNDADINLEGVVEVPGLGEVLDGTITGDELEAILKDDGIILLQSKFRLLREREPKNKDAILRAIGEIGARAGSILGRSRSKALIGVVSTAGASLFVPNFRFGGSWVLLGIGFFLALTALDTAASARPFDHLLYRPFARRTRRRLEAEALRRFGLG